jgi:hypothetical protein
MAHSKNKTFQKRHISKNNEFDNNHIHSKILDIPGALTPQATPIAWLVQLAWQIY